AADGLGEGLSHPRRFSCYEKLCPRSQVLPARPILLGTTFVKQASGPSSRYQTGCAELLKNNRTKERQPTQTSTRNPAPADRDRVTDALAVAAWALSMHTPTSGQFGTPLASNWP